MSEVCRAPVVPTLVRHPSAILLTVLLVGVLVYPYPMTAVSGRVAFEAFGALVLALAIWSVLVGLTPGRQLAGRSGAKSSGAAEAAVGREAS